MKTQNPTIDRHNELLDTFAYFTELEEKNDNSVIAMVSSVEKENVLIKFLFYNKLSIQLLDTKKNKKPQVKQGKKNTIKVLQRYVETGDLTEISTITDLFKKVWSQYL